MYYSEEQVERLRDEQQQTLDKCRDVAFNFAFHEFANDKAKEYARHGLGRRLGTLQECLRSVFETIPPEADHPSRDEVVTTAVYLQSFIINCYGAFDNLAHLWVHERHVVAANGRPLARMAIGLGPGSTYVRGTLPQSIRERLTQYDEWFGYLEGYRHALAHRIPLYVPDRSYRPDDAERLHAIDNQRNEALAVGDFDQLETLDEERARLGFFQPVMMHSFGEGAAFIFFHPQMIADLNTVIEIAELIFEELAEA